MKFEINGIEWTIREEDEKSKYLTIIDQQGKECQAIGFCAHENKYILLAKQLPKDQKVRTLRHELTHAFCYDCLVSNRYEFDQEALCEFVAIYSPRINQIADDYFVKNSCTKK